MMTGEPGIQTSLVRAIHNGIQVLVQVNGLTMDIYLIVEDVDFDRIPDILPKARFEQDGQIHVSSLGFENEAVEDEMESILANMDSDDTVLFFCADAHAYNTALDFINYTGERSFLPIS